MRQALCVDAHTGGTVRYGRSRGGGEQARGAVLATMTALKAVMVAGTGENRVGKSVTRREFASGK
ncbi:hypothetical protein [Amycolatopsis minnesotensis]|uniref:hypothetical protein n=1 Tax=Amycolatopsis minnesotensis TaxID=337894 RepID=UPI0031DDA15F